MYEQAPINVLTVVNASANGEGSYVQTAPEGKLPGESRARLFLNVTALVGSGTPTMQVSIVALIAGVDQEVVAFTLSPENASQESIVIEACPSVIKAKFVEGGTVTDFDATVDIVRF